jgi:hypothetical protein
VIVKRPSTQRNGGSGGNGDEAARRKDPSFSSVPCASAFESLTGSRKKASTHKSGGKQEEMEKK